MKVNIQGYIQGYKAHKSIICCSPVALLSDGEGRRLQREDLGADTQLSDPSVNHFAVLGSGIQDGHSPLTGPILLCTADLQLWLQTQQLSENG